MERVKRLHFQHIFNMKAPRTLLTSNGFRLKYVEPGRNNRSICCLDVSTESRFSICFTCKKNKTFVQWSKRRRGTQSIREMYCCCFGCTYCSYPANSHLLSCSHLKLLCLCTLSSLKHIHIQWMCFLFCFFALQP